MERKTRKLGNSHSERHKESKRQRNRVIHIEKRDIEREREGERKTPNSEKDRGGHTGGPRKICTYREW